MNRVVLLFCTTATMAWAQAERARPVSLGAVQVHSRILQPSQSTTIPITVDASPGGRDNLDIVFSDPAVTFSLQLPGGTVVNGSNAAANGYVWHNYEFGPNPGAQTAAYLMAGRHLLIRFPATYPSGVYTLSATNGSAAVAAVEAHFDSNSRIQLGVVGARNRFESDQAPIVMALFSNGGAPVNGANITGTYWSRIPTSAVQPQNFQLVQETTYATTKVQTYSFSVVNSGPEAFQVVLTPANSAPDVQVRTTEIFIARVPANTTTPTQRRLVVSVPVGTSFSPSSLTWTAEAAGSEAPLALADTGTTQAGTAGDGIYGAQLPLLPAAKYVVRLEGTGNVGGVPVVRHVWTEFEVVPLRARIAGSTFTEQTITNASGKLQTLRIGATVNIASSDVYSVAIRLKSSSGVGVTRIAKGSLAAGTQQVQVDFSAADLLSLGADGPWQYAEMSLSRHPATGTDVLEKRWNAGSTATYSLSTLDQGDFYFAGPVSAVGIDRDGTGKFDLLRVSIPAVTPGGECEWNANLDAVSGNVPLDFAGNSAQLTAGPTVLTIDFNGYAIAQANANGPYRIRDITVACSPRETTFVTQPQITGFTASQFRSIPKAMSISPAAPSLAVPRGGSASIGVNITGQGGLQQIVALSVTGLPTNTVGSFAPFAETSMGEARTLTVSATAAATLGSTAVQINGVGPTASATTPLTIQVVPGSDFTLTVPSGTITLAPGSQSAIVISVTPLNSDAGTVTFSVTGLPAGATSGFAPGSIVTSGTTTLTISVSANTAPGSYPITVTANNGEVVKTLPLSLVADPLAMPFPWAVQHVGVGSAGATASHSNGVFTLAGPGSALNGVSDIYHSAAQTVTGDAVFLARISRLQNAGKAGLMIRESAAVGAPGVFFGWTSANTLTLQSRAAFNSAWAPQTTAPQTVPAWLRLQRTGNSFSASTSNDGLRWTAMGAPLAVTVASSATAALTAVSETSGLAVSADFDHAIVSPGFYLSDPWPLTKTTNQQATFAFTAPALGGFTGSVIPSVSGLPAGATGQFAAASFAAGSGTILTVTNTSAAAGTYPLTITATSGNLTQRTYATLVVSATAPAIPDPWSAQTIGTATAGSGVTFANGVHTVAGGGAGFDGIVDAFQFDATALAGDGDVSARLVSITNPVTNGRAGVMIRDEGTANSAFAFAGALKTASGYQVEFVTRTTAGAAVTVESGPVATLPVWTRVTRAGNIFTAAWSADGISWTAFGTARTISMPGLVLAGAAVTSRDQAQLMTCAFDNLRAGGSNDFSLTLLPAARSIPAAQAMYYHTVRMTNAGGSAGSASLSIAGVPAGVTATFTAASITAGTPSNLQLAVATGVAPGTYPLTITAAGTVTRTAVLALTVTATGTALPLPWAADEIGTAGVPGVSTLGATTATLQGSGGRIFGNADALRYTYRALTGDGTIQFRGVSWNNIWDTARMGVMIRDSLAADATYAYARLRADVVVGVWVATGTGIQSRNAYGAASAETEVAPASTLPYSLRLTRLGNTFTAYGSTDGMTWQQMGQSVNIPMPPTVFIGYALSSGRDDGLTTFGLDSSFFAAGPDFYVQSQQATYTVPLGNASAYYNVSVNALNGFNGTVTLSTPGLPAGVTATWLPASLTPGISRLTIKTAPSLVAGTYPITLSATDGTLTRTTTVNLVVDGSITTPAAPFAYDFVGAGVPSGAIRVTSTAGVVQFTGSECCVGGTGDKFVFLHQPVTGGSVTARLTAVPSGTGRAGLMLRDTLDPGSPFVAVSLTGASPTLRIESRTAQGAGASTLIDVASLEQGPISFWIRMVRNGGTVTVFGSKDGVQWAPLSTPITVSLAGTVEAGLYAAGGDATFDGVAAATQPAPILSAFPARAYSMSGQAASFRLQLFPAGGTFPGTPTYAVTGLPANVTAAFTDPAIPDASANSTGVTAKTMTVTAAAGAVTGTYPLTVTATLGAVTASATVTLAVSPGFNIGPASATFGPVVNTAAGFYAQPNPASGIANSYAFSFPVTLIGGYTTPVFLTLRDDMSNPPTYVQTITPSTTVSASGTYNVAVQADPARVALGMHRLRVTAQSQDGTIVEQLIPLELGPFLAYSTSPGVFAQQTVAAGAQRTYALNLRRWYGLSDAVNFTHENFTNGIALAFNPNPAPAITANPTSFTDQAVSMTVSVPAGTANGVYVGGVRSAAPAVSRGSSWTVRVTGSLALSATPATRTIAPGASTTYTATFTLGSGTDAGPYDFSAVGLPAGATATFSQPSLAASGTTVMTVTTAAATPLGTYPINVRATSTNDSFNFVVNSAAVSLVVSPPAYTVTATTPATVSAGASATSTVTITPDAGFSGPVTLSASGLPAGTTATFATNPVNTSGTSVMTLATSAATPGGTFTVTITGTNGSTTRTGTVTLTVRSFTLSAAPTANTVPVGGATAAYVTTLTMVQGYSQTTTFTATGLPTGATAAFTPATRTSTGTTNLVVTTAGTTPEGTSNINIVATGTGGAPVQSIPATLTVTPGFTLTAAAITATAGASGTGQVAITASAGLTGATSLAVTAGLPSGATASFAPATVTGTGNSTLTIATTAATAGGTYTITVTGTNGSVTRTATFTLTVRSFTLTVSPATRTITRGSNTTYGLTLTMQGGFNSSTAFSATGLPAGVTAAFSPATRTSTGTSTVTITTNTSTPRAAHTLTFSAISGAITKTVTVTLTVN